MKNDYADGAARYRHALMDQKGAIFKMKIKMLKDNVLVEKIEETERGGILLPESVELKDERCDLKLVRVIHVGPDVQIPIKAGDLAFMSPMKGKDYSEDGKDYLILKEIEVEGKVED